VEGRRTQRPVRPGTGVILIKLKLTEDRVLGFIASVGVRDRLTVEASCGGKGRELLQRGQFIRIVAQDLVAPPSLEGPAS